MEGNETVAEAHSALQASVRSWGGLLIASGGALKPVKCFSHILSFRWKSNGKWAYEANEKDPSKVIRVPTAEGDESAIANLSADTACKTLGVFTAPSGNATKAIEAMQEKAGNWVERARGRNLHRRQVWFMMEKQFWPRVSYGLCANTASWSVLEDCLQKQYHKLLPIGGIVSSSPTGMRQLD